MKKITLMILLLIFTWAHTAHAKPIKHRIQIKHSKLVKHAKRIPAAQYAHSRANVLLMNITDNAVVNGSYDSTKVSIASISKLMTIYTVLKNEQNFSETLMVRTNLRNHTRLCPGMQLTRGDLVKLALVHSDNLAAVTLSENFVGGQEAFMRSMNTHAKNLGMYNSTFYEPTGLDANNSSTLQDVSLLTNAASKYEIFRQAAQTETLVIDAVRNNKIIKIRANPTSTMFGRAGVVTIKTGFTNAAGFCITMLVHCEDKVYNLVILGAHSKKERTYLIEKSLKTIYNT
jgi:D-alanyl-D-alanine endopeptidase (penicillin-binding protein 7)